MALRLLFHEPRAAREQLMNLEEVIMDWTTFWMIETIIAFLESSPFILFGENRTTPPSVRGEHQDPCIEKDFVSDSCRHTRLVSHRNGQLGNARPDVSVSLQWFRVSLLSMVYPLHSLGSSHADRRELFGLWASLSPGSPLRQWE